MKGIKKGRGWAATVASVVFAGLFCALAAVGPARAAELPPELKQKLADGLSDGAVRDQVRVNLSKALEGGALPDALVHLVDRVLEGGVNPLALEHLTGTLARAVERKLPPGPVVAKVLEGVAKNIPGDRLVMAVDKVLERLEFAGEVARLANSRDDDRDEFIVRTADAVAAGMDRNRLRSLAVRMAERKTGNKVSSLQVMEIVKTASAYGIAQDKVEGVARALMDDERADGKDVQRILRSLVKQDGDRDGAWKSDEKVRGDNDGDDGDDGGDGEGTDDGSNDSEHDDGPSGDDGSGGSDDSHETSESPGGEPEHD
ncbi:MAG: hypothetical protein RRA32_00675 [bacterium]|nr:hypothetical protein [bacterium]